MAVFNENGGFTEVANELSKELKEVIEPILIKYIENGMTIEEISYIIGSAADKICLRNQIEKRLSKK